jgi:hypothetical protein
VKRLLIRFFWLAVILVGVGVYQLGSGQDVEKEYEYNRKMEASVQKLGDCWESFDAILAKQYWTDSDKRALSRNLDCMIEESRLIGEIEVPARYSEYQRIHDLSMKEYRVLSDVRQSLQSCINYEDCYDLAYDMGRWEGLRDEIIRELDRLGIDDQ